MQDSCESADNQRLCPAHTLPIELVARIFSFLDIFDISLCSAVCRRWEVIAKNSPLVGKIVIVDLKKWRNNRCDEYTCPEWRITGNKELRGERLLKHFITLATRHVVLRWPLDSSLPEPKLCISHPDQNPDMFSTHYHCNYSGSIDLDVITEILQRLQRSLGNVIVSLTLQNVKLCTNDMALVPHSFPMVHYSHVQVYCHIKPSDYGHYPKPIVLRVEIDRKTLKGDDLEPLKDACMNYICFRYFNLFLPALSPEEQTCMDRVLRSHQKFDVLTNWNGYFGRHMRWENTLADMQLTMNEIRTYPLWQQYLARDLLQYHPLDSSETPANAQSGRSAVQRVLGPFKREYTESTWMSCNFTEGTTSVPPPFC
ncbi:uncharacterized protein LOC129591460 isoform X2 [Paramacrobiotus metropolitanus]|nr:uncharacterized protein LOC129591460 isoform X2 [Paramacrobiotus metropolitanus]